MAALISMPLVRKELRQALRGHGAFVLQNLYLLVVGVVAVTAGRSAGLSGDSPSWQVGVSAFWTLLYVQIVAVTLIGTALTASTVTTEQEQKTLDILLSTPLVKAQIVRSKLLAGFVTGGTVLLVSAPVAAACYLLGGVSLSTAVSAYVVLYAALLLTTALGLYCSVLVRRTTAANPLAIACSLAILLFPISFQQEAPALSACSTLWGVHLVLVGQPLMLFGHGLPPWLIPLVFWGIATLTLVQAATQGLCHPHLRRLWPVRWRLGLLFVALAALAMGSLPLRPQGPPPKPDAMAEMLGSYAIVSTYALLLLTVWFAAGVPTPLDRRRRNGESTAAYGIGERLFGYSLPAGGRYLLLLGLVILAVGEIGLWVWGRDLAQRWAGPMALSFLPALTAVWSYGVAARLTGLLRWPRTDLGRRVLAFVWVALLVVIPPAVAGLASLGRDEPRAISEFLAALAPGGGVIAAFPGADTPLASAFMKQLAQAAPLPLLTTAWHLLFGALLVGCEAALRRRRDRAAAATVAKA